MKIVHQALSFTGTLALALSCAAFNPVTSVATYRTMSMAATTGTASDTLPFASDTTMVKEVTRKSPILQDFQHHTSSRLPYSPTGYSTWKWRTHHNSRNQNEQQKQSDSEDRKQPHSLSTQNLHQTEYSINYLEMGDPSQPALLLIHGFGASSYHFRHNIPVLARKYHVYALDLLGFGWSDKPVMDYDASVWRDQIVDFVREVILSGDASVVNNDQAKAKPITIAGNSLGGYTAMYSASDDRIKNYVKGCILLNAAGRFRDPALQENPPDPNPIVKSISSAIQRLVIAISFVYTKQPARIEQILRNVYPINNSNVDQELVLSIQTPSLDENAAEVFYRVITKNGRGPQAFVDDILERLECPLLLAWGESDPWIRPAAADRIEMLYGRLNDKEGVNGQGGRWCRRVSVAAGHCPHDEAPDEVNKAILEFVEEVLDR